MNIAIGTKIGMKIDQGPYGGHRIAIVRKLEIIRSRGASFWTASAECLTQGQQSQQKPPSSFR
ncbi:MAG TPA: hypothetical protein VFS20_03005 [Longimicrobium sp.]|nr:hypothetical protein [Longimicrobium sp.]